MHLNPLIPLLLVCLGPTCDLDSKGPQAAPQTAAVEEATRDYVEGFFTQDVDRVERAIHSGLRKLTLRAAPWGGQMLVEIDSQGLFEISRLSRGPMIVDSATITVDVLAVSGKIATAKIDCAEFIEYVHLAKVNDEWRIVSLLGLTRGGEEEPAASAEERKAIEEVVFEYVDGYYAADSKRIAEALHPRLRKAAIKRLPNGREYLGYSTPEFHIESAKTKKYPLPARIRNIEIVIHDVSAGIATVTVDSRMMLEYLHLVRLDGEWKVIDEVWKKQQPKVKPRR